MKLIITNIVYGDTYTNLFLNYHLPSLLDDTNLPMYGKNTTYVIFTDNETQPILMKHPNVLRLMSICEVVFEEFSWRQDAKRFELRYSVLVGTFKMSVERACAGAYDYLCTWTADMVLAKNFFPKVLERMREGHDAVLMQPPRAAAETASPHLDKAEGALSDIDLWNVCFKNLHPLWVACHWDSPTFTSMPFSLLWNTGYGLLVRSYSVTPIIFKPTLDMMETKKVVDAEIPQRFKNPFFAHDWDEAPIIQSEPVCCYYPPFVHEREPYLRGSGEWVRGWSNRLDKSQLQWLKKVIYYPNKTVAKPTLEIEGAAELVKTILLLGVD